MSVTQLHLTVTLHSLLCCKIVGVSEEVAVKLVFLDDREGQARLLTELAAYLRLQDLQGDMVPRLMAYGTATDHKVLILTGLVTADGHQSTTAALVVSDHIPDLCCGSTYSER